MNTNSPYGPNLVINSGLTNFRSTLNDIRKWYSSPYSALFARDLLVTVKFEHQYYTGDMESKAQLRVTTECTLPNSSVETSSTTFDYDEYAFINGYDADWLDTMIKKAVTDTQLVTEQYISQRASGAHITDEMLVGWFDDMFSAQLEEVGITEGIIATPTFVDLEIISVDATIV